MHVWVDQRAERPDALKPGIKLKPQLAGEGQVGALPRRGHDPVNRANRAFGRGTCFAYALLHLGLTLPLYGLVLPFSSEVDAGNRSFPSQSRVREIAGEPAPDRQWLVFAMLATGISLGWAISSVLSVHLRLAPGRVGIEPSGPILAQNALGQDRASGVAGAEK